MIDADWRQPLIDYIKDQLLPQDKALMEQIQRRSKSYVLVGDKLYKRGSRSGVLMKCVSREEGKEILAEIHKGICGNHASSRTIVGKAFRAAFYWPTALADAEALVRQCQGCQFFAKQQHVPAYKLITIPPTWPFACWGLDMIGPLPTAPGGFNRVLVAIDKFTKWIEVKPVTCPKADRVLDFLDDIVHRFGFPNRIITDLGSNFNNQNFWDYCENSGIDVRYVSVAHPRANGQVERANGMILDALKKRLHDAANNKGGRWLKELQHVVWGLRTQPCKPTGQTPYFLVYGSEAILPADIMWNSPTVEHYDEEAAEEVRRLDIDSLEEARSTALIQSARYLEGLRRYHDRNVKERSFNVGDLILRRIQDTKGLHKLSSPWEGPYVVSAVTGPGTYRLQTLSGEDIDNSWNIEHLCRFYPQITFSKCLAHSHRLLFVIKQSTSSEYISLLHLICSFVEYYSEYISLHLPCISFYYDYFMLHKQFYHQFSMIRLLYQANQITIVCAPYDKFFL